MTPKKVPLTTTMDEHMFEPSGEVEDYADLDVYEESEERIEEENIGMEKRPKMSTVTSRTKKSTAKGMGIEQHKGKQPI